MIIVWEGGREVGDKLGMGVPVSSVFSRRAGPLSILDLADSLEQCLESHRH